jgi:adenylosuccinate lyase
VDVLDAITPLDGRYRGKLAGLAAVVGEGGLIRYRLQVESRWLLFLAAQPEIAKGFELPPAARAELERCCLTDGGASERRVKEIEATTNHDVKAVEYLMRERLTAAGAPAAALAYIHFACTSEDINNLAYALMLKDWRDQRLVPLLDQVIHGLAAKAKAHAALPMLARTHGQTAAPTTLGKELAVFGHRLQRQRAQLAALRIEGKINGAVGNFNAHLSAFPNLDWQALARTFIERDLGLAYNPLTTQIENHDSFVEALGIVRHAATVAIGLCRDVWGYVSLGYFRQRAVKGEVGSSTMPHKVNPIDFENAEGNFGLAAGLIAHFQDKLLISRWQRDLSDSTVLRALGEIAGHTELALQSLLKGLGKVEAAPERLAADLDGAWEVLAEPIQTVLRRHGVVDAYERLKEATRDRAVGKDALHALIKAATELPEAEKTRLLSMTPALYVGCAARLAEDFVKRASV